ncbi:hypothetical protein F0U62_06940 [Cystobacter fuscus]|uniref:hypothetical protein n=1 Tax=Cystobacter fuscus TaxID=43 RepID=UPI002B2E7D65|nr:hypothetical protein F0U62_06940 [Cystobacter fuscus]
MTPVLPDEDLLAKIDVKDVRSYLDLTGWQLVDEQPERIARYTKTRDDTGRQYVVTVPLKQSFTDYPARILDLVATLSDAEHRSGEVIALTLIQGRFDSLQARIEDDGSRDGSIDLVDGAAAFQSMKELLLYSAIAEKGPKPVYSSPSYEETKRLLKGSRLAQTQRGSFVLSVVTEIPFQEQTLPGFPDAPEPHPRKVMRRLATALQAAHEAGIEDTEAAFRKRVESGLSANFCAAIGRFGRSGSLHGVSFNTTASRTRRVNRDACWVA